MAPPLTTLKGRLPDPANFWRPALLILLLILLPGVLIGTVGVLVLVLGRGTTDVVLGVLILCFTAALGAGIVLTLFSMRRRANLSALQSAFVHKVSHEFRTPLTSIRMFVETLKMGRIQDPEKVQECLDVILEETDRLSAMIDRLLEWAVMESGRKSYHLEPVEVKGLVARAVSAFTPQRHLSDGVGLDVEVEPSLPPVRADEDALCDVLLNLLNNAYKYTGDDKKIRIVARGRAEGVVISVADNGPGIAPSEHRRIFDRFYRGEHPRIDSIEGSGLGLAMAQHVVRAHKGTIELQSELGRGSTFSITLPAA